MLHDLPPISPLAMKLISTLAYSDVNVRTVEDLIERDTVLCGEVMRTVNSARFAGTGNILRIHDAIMRLGVNQLRKMALGLSVKRLFGHPRTGNKWSQIRFNLHSAAVAVLADLLASHVPVASGDAAFVAGMLHDVGKFAIAVNLKKEYDVILDLWTSSGRSLVDCEREVLGFDHAEVSGMMLARWELAAPLQRAVFYHHRPEDLGPDVSLAHILNLADRFVRYLGMVAEPQPVEPDPPCLLQLPGHTLPEEEILARFGEEYQDLSQFFR